MLPCSLNSAPTTPPPIHGSQATNNNPENILFGEMEKMKQHSEGCVLV